MTRPSQPPVMSLPAYADYQSRENAARNTYLTMVIAAHHEYLAGAFPDRDAYDAVDRSAWTTYYASCRRIWQEYQQRCRDATDAIAYGQPPANSRYYDQTDPGTKIYPRPAATSNPYPQEDESWLSR